jgi:tetratricopeptide (TPR) repeat protein
MNRWPLHGYPALPKRNWIGDRRHHFTNTPLVLLTGFDYPLAQRILAIAKKREMSASEQTLRKRPRVFISYSHDSAFHCDRVLALAQQLRRDGINAELDQFHQEKLVHWPRWCEEQLRPENSDFVLCVCTAEFKRRIERRVPAQVGKGVFWEGTQMYNYLYDDKGNQRCVPLLFDNNTKNIPSFLNGYTCFELDVLGLQNIQSQYSKLYRLLSRQAATAPTEIGEPQKLSPFPEGERRTDFILLIQEAISSIKTDTNEILSIVRGSSPPRVEDGALRRSSSSGHINISADNLKRPHKYIERELVGREAFINETIAECSQFPANTEPIVIAFHGIPGVGKSSVALKIARKIAEKVRDTQELALTWWLTATEITHQIGETQDRTFRKHVPLEMERSLRELGVALKLETDGLIEQDALAQQIVSRISALRSWILVLDDAPSQSAIWKLRPSGSGLLIVTSRNPEWGDAARLVGLLSEEDSIQVLAKYCKDDKKDLAELARAVKYLPLALVQVGAYIQATEAQAIEVTKTLGAAPLHILGDLPIFSGYMSAGVRTVAKTMSLILDDLHEVEPYAEYVFSILVHFGERVPWRILRSTLLKYLRMDSELVVPFEKADLTKATVLVPLIRRALLARDRDELIIHGLVTRVSVALLWERKRYVETALRLLTERFPNNPDDMSVYRLASGLLRSAVFIIQTAKPDINSDELLIRVARHLVIIGDHKFALPILNSLVRIFRKKSRRSVRVIAELALAQGALFHQAGSLSRARSVWRRGVAALERYQSAVNQTLRKDRRAQLVTLRMEFRLGLASLLGDMGRPLVGYSLCRHAEIILEINQSTDARLRADTGISAARSLLSSGRPKEALDKIDQLLRRWGKQLPRKSFRRLSLLYFKAGTLRAIYRLTEAIETYKQALELVRSGFGETHKDFGNILNDIGGLELLVGDLEEADKHLYRAAEIIGLTYRRDHPAYASMLRDVALLCFAQEKFGKGVEVATKAVAILRSAPPSARWRLPAFLTVLARGYYLAGEWILAESSADEAVRLSELRCDYPQLLADSLRQRAIARAANGDRSGTRRDIATMKQKRALSNMKSDESLTLDVLAEGETQLILNEVSIVCLEETRNAAGRLRDLFGAHAPDSVHAYQLIEKIEAVLMRR